MRRTSILAAFGIATAALWMVLAPYELVLRDTTADARSSARSFWIEGADGPAGGRPDSVADLAEALSPAVVNIQTERTSGPGGERIPGEEFLEEFFPRR